METLIKVITVILTLLFVVSGIVYICLSERVEDQPQTLNESVTINNFKSLLVLIFFGSLFFASAGWTLLYFN